MARNVYVTAMEPGSGKSAVVLGLTEMLSRHAERLAFYRPFIATADVADPAVELIRHRYRLTQSYRQSFALTRRGPAEHRRARRHDALLKRILDGYATVSAGADVVIVEGSDFTDASLAIELDLNVDAANHLGCPVLLVVGGRRRSAEQVLEALHQGLGALRERGCALLAAVCNRVTPNWWTPCGRALTDVAGGLPAAVLPEVFALSAPTVAEVAGARRRAIVGPAALRRGRSRGWSSARWGSPASWSGWPRGTL